jgi:ribosomal protein S27AE
VKVIGTTSDGNPMVELNAQDREAIMQAAALLGSFPVMKRSELPAVAREIAAAAPTAPKPPAPTRKKPGPKPKTQKPAAERKELKCPNCGKVFLPRRKDQKCCCTRCNNKHNNALRYRKPAAKPTPPPPAAGPKLLTPEQKAAREAAIRDLLRKRRQLTPEEQALRDAERDAGVDPVDPLED